MKELTKILSEIQAELNCPKSQFNSFGKYNYRSCEDIVEAVKPLLHKHHLVLTMDDAMINVGNFNYIQTTVSIGDGESFIQTKAIAREAEDRKGMDASQITGATSSYARKYALNGLFAIDDTKDADTMKPVEKEAKKPLKKSEPITVDTLIAFVTSCKTIKSLNDYYKQNEDIINGFFKKEKEEVLEAFAFRKSELKGEPGPNSESMQND